MSDHLQLGIVLDYLMNKKPQNVPAVAEASSCCHKLGRMITSQKAPGVLIGPCQCVCSWD
jgi:hypothetical protein